MELSTHPLLTLVERNKNCLKSMLTHYIDTTVDNQFASLKDSIETMIATGQIGPQHCIVTAFGTTLPPPTQANTDQSSAQCLNECSNDTLTRAQEHQNTLQNEVSMANTINNDDLMIKQEFDDENEEMDEKEIDDDNVTNYEKCEKGICNSVHENYDNTSGDDAETGENGDETFETQQIVDAALESNQMNQSNHAAPTDISINELIERQNTQIVIDQFDDNDNYIEDDEDGDNEYLNNSNCEDCTNGVCELDHGNNNDNHYDESFETLHVDTENIQTNQSMISNGIDETPANANNELQFNGENDQLHNVQRSNKQNSKKKTGHLIKSRTRRSVRSVINEQIDSSTPSTSGVRSWTRKRIQRKVFGDDQSDSDGKRHKYEKRKSVQLNKSVNKVKQLKIENCDQDIDEDGDNNQEEVKSPVVLVELHCTEPACSKILQSRLLWKEHMRNDHNKQPYHQLKNNFPLNDRDQTEYPCIEHTCNHISTSQIAFIQHWRYHHQPGKFRCSTCPIFVADLYCKVHNHFDTTHGSHACPHKHCGKKFITNFALKQHERVHTGERPYKCTWKKCESSFKLNGAAVQHVRMMHFNLPKTTKEQNERNIIDSRDPYDYIHKIEHLL